jgi:hypothetical protein
MKRATLLGILTALGLASALIAQQATDQLRPPPRYNRATETVVRGTVEEVSAYAGPAGLLGTHLLLRTGGNTTVDVYLGLPSLLGKDRVAFAPGDQIEVLGSKVLYRGGEALLARQIKRGEQVLTYRNAQGIPLRLRGRGQYPRGERSSAGRRAQ